MHLLNLLTPLPIGRVVDALEHLPEVVLLEGGAEPAQHIAIETRAPTSEQELFDLCDQVAKKGAQLLIAAAVAKLHPTRKMPLPVVGVIATATATSITNRVKQLEHDELSPRPPDTELMRSEISGVIDRAADALQGHIIVEDQDFQMLVYSRFSAPIDQARRDAILQRRMPGYLQQVFNAQGVQASLIRGEDVVEVEPDVSAGLGRRLVVAIRHRGRLVGTLWFARATPFTPRDTMVLRHAAAQIRGSLAAALRLKEDEQIKRDDAVLDLLRGQRTQAALRDLNLDPSALEKGAHVITFAHLGDGGASKGMRFADFRVLLANSSWAVQNEVVTVADGDHLHVVHFGCPEPDAECEAANPRLLASYFTESLQKVGVSVAVGIGYHAQAPAQLPDSADSAGNVLDAMLRLRRPGVGTSSAYWAPLLVGTVLREEPQLRGRVPVGLERLLETDSERARELISTVLVALDHWGDVSGAAERLHVHHNTVRYRLQRFADMTGVDLRDPDVRLAVWLLLKRVPTVADEASELDSSA